MTYHIIRQGNTVAVLYSRNGIITKAEGSFAWTMGKTVSVVLLWISKHGMGWKVSV